MFIAYAVDDNQHLVSTYPVAYSERMSKLMKDLKIINIGKKHQYIILEKKYKNNKNIGELDE